MVGRRQQIGLGHAANGLNVLGDLGGHEQATVTGLGPLADLDQNAGRVFDHVRHGLNDAVPTEVTRGDLQDHVFEIFALQQADRHAPFAGAHAHRQSTLFVEISHGHGNGFPHAPGQGADGHVANDHRIDPAHRRRLTVLGQAAVGGLMQRQCLGRQDPPEGRQTVEGVTLSVEARVGHLRNTADTQGVQRAGLDFQIVAAAALGAGAGGGLVDHMEARIGVAGCADGIIGTDPLTDTAAPAEIFEHILLGNDRLSGEAGFGFRGLAVAEDHPPALHLGSDGVEGTGRDAGPAEGAAVLVVGDFPGKIVAGEVINFYCFHLWTSKLSSMTTISRSFG